MRGLRSGDWGDIPDDWDLVKLTRAVRIPNGLVDPTKDEFNSLRLIAPNHVESHTGRLLDWESAEDQGASSGKYLVREGDIVYSKIRPALNKVTIAPERSLCSADMYPVRPREGLLDSRYLMYAMLSPAFLQRTVDESMRVAMPKVNRESLGAVHVPVPPLDAQRAIGDFLDRETAKIDTLIEKKQRLLELLDEKRTALITRAVTRGLDPDVPMKDSGVEWLGEIPADWDTARLKAVASLQTGLTLGKSYSGEVLEVPYLRVANVQAGHIDTRELATVEVPTNQIDRYSLSAGDVLMTEGGDFDKLGRGHVWDARIDPCLHQNHIFAVKTDGDRLLPEWLAWVTTSGYGRAYFTATSKQSTNLASTNATKVQSFPLPLPSTETQRAILDEMTEELGRLGEIKQGVEHAVALLREYRSAVISAAVTGRIEVRER